MPISLENRIVRLGFSVLAAANLFTTGMIAPDRAQRTNDKPRFDAFPYCIDKFGDVYPPGLFLGNREGVPGLHVVYEDSKEIIGRSLTLSFKGASYISAEFGPYRSGDNLPTKFQTNLAVLPSANPDDSLTFDVRDANGVSAASISLRAPSCE